MLLAMYQKKEMTVLLKEHGKYCIVKKPVLSLLEEACLFYGSTLQAVSYTHLTLPTTPYV